MADAPLFVYIPQLNKSAHVSVGQFWSIDLQTAVVCTCTYYDSTRHAQWTPRAHMPLQRAIMNILMFKHLEHLDHSVFI